ncbi:hypothetical protein FBY21_2697 [Pseudomonas sp. SLBN-26]|uniref:hypothetical protein n=1 Tax=Pseudomonadaceae TaxID=135621 RepID=UPI001151A29F|nr:MULTISPECIES: hypothetical protein [Pseudomonas]MCP1618079.1 hypothetical protein [Pseudomonas otitidis]TQL07317.1 hypothetical protein FBY21_2697 [Pseudomonas sp. SLBN-26]
MSRDVEQQRLHDLLERLDSRLNAVHMIAAIIQDNAGRREGIPGPFLNEVREGALMDVMVDLCQSNQQDFWQLMKLEKLPLFRD